jgi:hypothetical protein
MNVKRIMTPVALVLALAMSGVPALAQSRERVAQRRPENRSARSNTNREPANSRGSRVSEGRSAPQERAGAQRQAVPRAAPRVESRREDPRRNDSRGTVSRGYEARGSEGRGNDSRAYDSRRYDARPYDSPRSQAPRYDTRRYAVPRYAVPRYDARRYDNRWLDGRWYSGRAYVSGYYSRSYRPGTIVRFGLGFSIFAGSPFAFTFGYGRTPAYAYRYPIRAGFAYGGMSFLVDPDFAEVYIDGIFVGYAREFGGQPIPVAAGYHRVEIHAPDCEGVVFDVNVLPGQVIPYRGSLVPLY